MQHLWKNWFIDNFYPLTDVVEKSDRKYTFKNFYYTEVPFHNELKSYILSLNTITVGTSYEVYHVHRWEQGSFFNEHVDSNKNRRWAYVCELKSSECGTSLLVEGIKTKEGLFDCTTLHEVPTIKEGVRISLTVFGLPA